MWTDNETPKDREKKKVEDCVFEAYACVLTFMANFDNKALIHVVGHVRLCLC